MLREHYEIAAAVVVSRTRQDKLKQASNGPRKCSAAQALGPPYGWQLTNPAKPVL